MISVKTAKIRMIKSTDILKIMNCGQGPGMLLEQMRQVVMEHDTEVHQRGRKDVTVLDKSVQTVLTGLSSVRICTLKTVQQQLTTEDNVEVDIRTVAKAVDTVHLQVGIYNRNNTQK